MKRLLSPVLASFAIVSVLGCGPGTDPNRPKTYPVSGTITQSGKPIDGANVTFHLIDGSRSAIGVTDAGGRYTLTTFDAGDGAVAGEYRVTITKYDRPQVTPKSDGSIGDTGDDEPEEPESGTGRGRDADDDPKSLLPEQYANPETSGLTATVGESGNNTFDFSID